MIDLRSPTFVLLALRSCYPMISPVTVEVALAAVPEDQWYRAHSVCAVLVLYPLKMLSVMLAHSPPSQLHRTQFPCQLEGDSHYRVALVRAITTGVSAKELGAHKKALRRVYEHKPVLKACTVRARSGSAVNAAFKEIRLENKRASIPVYTHTKAASPTDGSSWQSLTSRRSRRRVRRLLVVSFAAPKVELLVSTAMRKPS